MEEALGSRGRQVETDKQVHVPLENRGAVGPAGARRREDSPPPMHTP